MGYREFLQAMESMSPSSPNTTLISLRLGLQAIYENAERLTEIVEDYKEEEYGYSPALAEADKLLMEIKSIAMQCARPKPPEGEDTALTALEKILLHCS